MSRTEVFKCLIKLRLQLHSVCCQMANLAMQKRTQAFKQLGAKTNGGIKHAFRSGYRNAWQFLVCKKVPKPLNNWEQKRMVELSMHFGPDTKTHGSFRYA